MTTTEGQRQTGRSAAPRWSPPQEPQQGTDVASLMRELQERSRSIDRASNELFRLTEEFEGGVVEVVDIETGEITMEYREGPKLRFEIALIEAVEEIASEYEKDEKKVPAAERLKDKAKVRVRTRNPELWDQYQWLQTRVTAMQKWISARKETLSARQSVLSAEKAIVNG